MSIDALLNKITAQSDDVIAVMVRHNDRIHHNLCDPYDLIRSEDVLDALQDAFDLTEELQGEGLDFTDLVLGFDEHSVIARRLEGGITAVLARQMRRQHLLKLQVGLGLAARAIQRELSIMPVDAVSAEAVVPKAHETAAPLASAEVAPSAEKKIVRMYRGVAYYE